MNNRDAFNGDFQNVEQPFGDAPYLATLEEEWAIDDGDPKYVALGEERPIDDGSPKYVALGMVRQSEPGFMNELLAENEVQLTAPKFTIYCDLDVEGKISSGSLVYGDRGEFPGVYDVYKLNDVQLNALVNSAHFEDLDLENGYPGEMGIRGTSKAEAPEIGDNSMTRTKVAFEVNEGIGNRYVGPIEAVAWDAVLQRVDGELVSHRAGQLDGINVDPYRPVEISYEFDGPSVRMLDREQIVSFER